MSDRKIIHIDVPALTRVEGEGALDIKIANGDIEHLQLKIFEPPRYFEKFLEGRKPQDVVDIVARICGICPVAYQMSAVQAVEAAIGFTVSPWVRDMRRVMYCGEWLQSHSLHIHLLALPDYFGFNDVTALAAQFPDEVKRGLKLQSLGNRLIALFGARSVHPVGIRPGGFFHAPELSQVDTLLDELDAAETLAEELIVWTSQIEMPSFIQDITCVSLRHEHDYPMNFGNIVSNKGLNIPIREFEKHFTESPVYHSTALHCLHQDQPYLVGPLARLNNNLDRLPEATRKILSELSIPFPSRNMFHSMLARAVEIHVAVVEAKRLLSNYSFPTSPYEEIDIPKGVSYGCTEAPRGILWHRYEFNKEGEISSARIVPPTSQNQARIEQDLGVSLKQHGLDKSDEELRLLSEKIVRNYDPCISCATHFLDLRVER